MKRIKTALKWLAIVAGSLLSIALLALAFFNWRAGACLEEQLQAARQTGAPMSIADLAPAPVSPDRNAVTYLRRAEKSVLAMNQELSALWQEHDDFYDKDRLNQRGIEQVESALAAYPDALPLIEQAAGTPEYAPDHDYTLLPPEQFLEPCLQKVQMARAVARLLQNRGELLLARHEREESLRNGLTMLRLDRHFQQEPMLVAYLVSIAVQSMAVSQIARGLDDGPVSAELYDQIDAEISKHLESQAFVWAVKTDRAYGIDIFRGIRSRFLPGVGKQYECEYLKRMAAEIEIGAAPRYKVEAALAQMKADTQGAGPLTLQMVPALEASREAQVRSLARVQCLSVLSSLLRSGTKPASIDELNLPNEVKLDPYNGQPLKIKQADAGWIVYSVGPNLKDDGGKIEKYDDVGVGPEG